MKRYFVRMKNGSKANGLAGSQLRHQEVRILQQQAVRAEHQLFGERRRIDAGAEIHAEVLDRGLQFRIDDGAIQRRFGDLEIGLRQQGRQLQRVLVVHETVFGDRVRRKARGQIVVEQQQFAERVPILRDGQAADQAVLRRRTQAGNFQRVSDPLDHALAVGARRLRQALRRHGPRVDPSPDGFPGRNMAVLELGVELVDPDARRTRFRVVASDTVLLEKRLYVLFERGFERYLRQRNSSDEQQRESKIP